MPLGCSGVANVLEKLEWCCGSCVVVSWCVAWVVRGHGVGRVVWCRSGIVLAVMCRPVLWGRVAF
eukprot:70575-Prorocentrum_lima.AAC.1